MNDILARAAIVTPFILVAAACKADRPTVAATQQMVFMTPLNGATVPGPDAAFEVALVNLDGSGFQQITSDGRQKFLPHFSPDATKIIYTKYSVGGYGSANARFDIALYDLATATETPLTTSGAASHATFSPDGSRVAYGAF